VSGPTQSTPLCIASLTFIVDLRRWYWLQRDEMQPPVPRHVQLYSRS